MGATGGSVQLVSRPRERGAERSMPIVTLGRMAEHGSLALDISTADVITAPLFEATLPEPVAVVEETTTVAPRAVRRRRVATALLTSDVVMLTLAALSATLLRFSDLSAYIEPTTRSLGTEFAIMSAAVIVLPLCFMYAARLYDLDLLGWGSGEFMRIVQSLAMGVVAIVLVTFFTGMPYLSREWIVMVWLLGAVLVILGRVALRVAGSRIMRQGGWLQRPTLIVGSNIEAAEIARILQSNPSAGLLPVGCLTTSLKDKLSLDYCAPTVESLGHARDLVDVVREHEIDTVVIVASAFDYEVLQRMIRELRDMRVSVHMSSALSEVLSSRVVTRAVSGIPVISLKGVSITPAALGTKRVFDLAISALLVGLGMPVWLALMAVIKATSKGPVFYMCERIGMNGKPFKMFKFRSMVQDADAQLSALRASNEADGPLFKMRDDPRITPVGKWMRRFSVDEFPQLLNVIRGEMSLVGPRPPLEHETLHYTKQDWRRLESPPGMTGLWQVSGRSNLTFREMVRLDVLYIDNWSVGLDLALLARTLPAVLIARGAY